MFSSVQSAFVFVLPCAATPMEIFSALLFEMCWLFFPGLLYLPVVYVFVCFGFFFKSVNMKWNVLGKSSVYCEQFVSWKHLSHSLDRFHSGSVVQLCSGPGKRPREFCVSLNSYAGVELYSPGTTSLLGEGRVSKPLNVSAQPWDWVQWRQWRHDKSVQNYYNIFLLMNWVELILSFTGLLGYLLVCNSRNRVAMTIRERQGSYCMEYFHLVW